MRPPYNIKFPIKFDTLRHSTMASFGVGKVVVVAKCKTLCRTPSRWDIPNKKPSPGTDGGSRSGSVLGSSSSLG